LQIVSTDFKKLRFLARFYTRQPDDFAIDL